MKVNLYVLEISVEQYLRLATLELYQALGSSPRTEDEVVEGHKVPKGKVWLFPIGGDYERLEKLVGGTRLKFVVDIP